MRSKRTRALATLAFVALMLGPSAARADDPVVEARADYDAAAAAYDRADYTTAATRFARADERVPNPRALRLAMASALLVSDAALAMNLVERSEERARSGALDPAVAELARKLRARFESGAGRIRVSCAADVPCKPSVDGEAMSATRVRWATPGKHRVVFETGGAPIAREIVVRAGERVDVPLAATDLAPTSRVVDPVTTATPARARDDASASGVARRGLSPAFFWSGVVATGAAASLATVFTVITKNRHDDFVSEPSAATADAGDAAQTRARVAWVVSGVLALGTVVLGVMTDFGARASSSARAPRFTVGVGPLAATVAGTF